MSLETFNSNWTLSVPDNLQYYVDISFKWSESCINTIHFLKKFKSAYSLNEIADGRINAHGKDFICLDDKSKITVQSYSICVYHCTAEQMKLLSRSGARSAGSSSQRHLGNVRNTAVTPEIPVQLSTTAERAQWFRALQIALKQAQTEGRGTR